MCKLFKWIIMSLGISLKCKCIRCSQYFLGTAGASTGAVMYSKNKAVKVKQIGTVWLLSLLPVKLHCGQYKESTSLCNKVAIGSEVKVALTMAKLAVLQ